MSEHVYAFCFYKPSMPELHADTYKPSTPELHAVNTDDIAGTDDEGETCTDWSGQAREACPLNPPPQPTHILLADPRPRGILGRLCLDFVFFKQSETTVTYSTQNHTTQRSSQKTRGRDATVKHNRVAAATRDIMIET